VAPAVLTQLFGVEAPALPWIAGYSLETADLEATCAYLRASGLTLLDCGRRRCGVRLPESVGGIVIFHGPGEHGLPCG
jgi:hypothetical protein